MNAKVTTYWKNNRKPVTRAMPEEEVAAYLDRCRETGHMKGYVVDAVPTEIQPRAPIFQNGDAVTTGNNYSAVFIGTDPKYPDMYVVRLDGFRSDYVLVKKDDVRRA